MRLDPTNLDVIQGVAYLAEALESIAVNTAGLNEWSCWLCPLIAAIRILSGTTFGRNFDGFQARLGLRF